MLSEGSVLPDNKLNDKSKKQVYIEVVNDHYFFIKSWQPTSSTNKFSKLDDKINQIKWEVLSQFHRQ